MGGERGTQCWAEHRGKAFAQEERGRGWGVRAREAPGFRNPTSTQHPISVMVQMGDSGRGFLGSVLGTLPLRSKSDGNEHKVGKYMALAAFLPFFG